MIKLYNVKIYKDATGNANGFLGKHLIKKKYLISFFVQNKIYLGRPGFGVEVLDARLLSSIRTLDTRLDQEGDDLEESRRYNDLYI